MAKYINKAMQTKILKFEKRLAEQKWEMLVETLESSKLEIREHDRNAKAMMIGVKGIEDMDIEVFQTSSSGDGVFAHIQIWYHPNYVENDKKYPKSVIDAMNEIGDFADAIEWHNKRNN